jgi:hypothetical protein
VFCFGIQIHSRPEEISPHTDHESIKGGFHQERTPRLVPVTMHACEPRSKHCKNTCISLLDAEASHGLTATACTCSAKKRSHSQLALTCCGERASTHIRCDPTRKSPPPWPYPTPAGCSLTTQTRPFCRHWRTQHQNSAVVHPRRLQSWNTLAQSFPCGPSAEFPPNEPVLLPATPMRVCPAR